MSINTAFYQIAEDVTAADLEEEKKNIRFLAQEMTAACSALIEESK